MAHSVQDKGYAWVICAASFMSVAINGGFLFTTGMFYIMFQRNLDAEGSTLSLITSINTSLHSLVCPLAGLLTERFGERYVASFGVVVATFGLALSSLSTNVYHLYVTYGAISGIGLGMVWLPSISIIPKYFKRYERIACGLAFSGLGVGTFIFPPLLNALENVYGWRGVMLMMAGINLQGLISAALMRTMDVTNTTKDQRFDMAMQPNQVKSTHGDHDSENHVQHSESLCLNTKTRPQKEEITKVKQFTLLMKNTHYVLLNLHILITYFSIYVIYTHFGAYILTLGFSQTHVVHIYMTMGITRIVFQLMTGFGAQVTKINSTALVMVCAVLVGVMTAILPLTKGLHFIYIYAVLFQILMSPLHTLTPTIISEIVPKTQVPSAYGILCFFKVPGILLGPPLAALLLETTQVYNISFHMAGGLAVAAGLLLVPAIYLKAVSKN